MKHDIKRRRYQLFSVILQQLFSLNFPQSCKNRFQLITVFKNVSILKRHRQEMCRKKRKTTFKNRSIEEINPQTDALFHQRFELKKGERLPHRRPTALLHLTAEPSLHLHQCGGMICCLLKNCSCGREERCVVDLQSLFWMIFFSSMGERLHCKNSDICYSLSKTYN